MIAKFVFAADTRVWHNCHLSTLSLMVSPAVVIMPSFDATNNDNVGIMTNDDNRGVTSNDNLAS